MAAMALSEKGGWKGNFGDKEVKKVFSLFSSQCLTVGNYQIILNWKLSKGICWVKREISEIDFILEKTEFWRIGFISATFILLDENK